MSGNEARLRRFDIARELMADGCTIPSDGTITAELERRLALQLAATLEASRGLAAPVVLRGLLSEEDIEQIYEYAEAFDSKSPASDDGEDAGPSLEPGSAEWLQTPI